MIFILASLGLPGTSGFVGEFLVLLSIFSINTYFAVFATTGVVLAATYSLWLYRRMIFGALIKDDLSEMLDLTRREIIIFVPLIIYWHISKTSYRYYRAISKKNCESS